MKINQINHIRQIIFHAGILVYAFILPVKLFSQSLLWKVTGNDIASPSFIYGTIHLKDHRVFEWKDSVYARINRCDAFAGEIELSSQNLLKATMLLILPEGQTLHDRFSPEDYQLIKSAVKTCSGYDLSLLDKFKPASLVALCYSGGDVSDLKATVDELLYQHAVAHGKNMIGIETIEEQASLLDKIPDSYVLEFFRNLEAQEREFEKLIRCYCRADLDSLWVLMQDEESGTLLNEELIRHRNFRMTERIIPIIRQQSTFIAIGSGHLPGNEGVLALLRKEGYVVEPERIVW